ncbi:MAG: preprotein translocase subunit SecY [Spirochaetaceae bacterium]|nr:preprotein translocase subunit SecY [Spirochaetaceae bacterium]MBP3449630.1 preprotein translocase subunit SecY [Spirochaetaceae bacterium]MBQ3023727.1 preprotein translocase subunit SecY [Spirochaetaceae bacterium]MBQ7905734.1 preprotein translocase subunit SecY [Spirochaetaceae bacterium]
MANNPIVNMFKVKELRSRIFFTFIVLAVYRLGSVLTIPGINPQALTSYFESMTRGNAFVDYMDFFAGGAFSNFSVFMLGVMPYISTQIIMQLALIIFPSLKRIAQEDGGQKKVQKWTRVGTVFVCLIQSMAVTVYAASIPGAVVISSSVLFKIIAMITVTTGTMVTIWLGEQITARGIGNGISMLIFAGIVARLPSAVWELGRMVKNGEINIVFVIVVIFMFVGIIALVVYEQQGQRKIPVHYAKRVVGRKMYGGQSTYIPFKINPSGVIPVIFASSFLTFPLQIATSLGPNVRWLNNLAAFLDPVGIWYNVFLVLLIVFFAYFYTQVTLNPTEIAKNVRENGGSIPGIRTDKMEEYMQKVLNRLVLPGSLYLAVIAVLPTIVQNLFGFPQSISMLMGGTSLLILVGVDLDTMSQVEALMKMHHQDGLVKKGKLRSRNL